MSKIMCVVCEEPVDIWKNEMVTNAWQKDGFNHYEFIHPDCGITQTHSVEIENPPKEKMIDDLIFSFETLMGVR